MIAGQIIILMKSESQNENGIHITFSTSSSRHCTTLNLTLEKKNKIRCIFLSKLFAISFTNHSITMIYNNSKCFEFVSIFNYSILRVSHF